jgi:hypothetical protein
MNKLSKKIAVFSLMVMMSLSLITEKTAKADITDAGWFDPVLGCVVGGGVGYAIASSGNQILTAAIGCGGGLILGLLLDSHYSSKYGRVYQADISNLRADIKVMQLQQALKSANGDDDQFGLRVRTFVPGQKLPNGDISAPTFTEKLIMPGENLKFGGSD